MCRKLHDNVALVEVHQELAMVRNGAKDMVTKNKRLKKKEKYAQGQLVEAQCQISELEEQLRAQQMENRQLATTIPQDEVRHLETSLAKAQKAEKIVETEVGRSWDELR